MELSETTRCHKKYVIQCLEIIFLHFFHSVKELVTNMLRQGRELD